MRLVHRFDPALVQANLRLISRILRPPRGNVENMYVFIGEWDEMVLRQDEDEAHADRR